MREFIETINEMGLKGVIKWIKRLLVSITMLEFLSYIIYWLISVEAMSKMILIAVPVAAICVTAIDDLIKEKEDICEDDEEIEEEEEEKEEA